MNRTVELVNLWAEYEHGQPGATLAGFCQAYLAGQDELKTRFWNTPVPPDTASVLTKLTGRIAKVHNLYATAAFKKCGLGSFDEFLYLNSIAHAASPKKTDIIYANFNELSSGLLILDRLKANKLVTEETDSEDRRSKRLTITKKGSNLLIACYKELDKINTMCFGNTPEEQIAGCIRVLTPVEQALAENWQKEKGK